jgi:spore coat polysaccharide biosynthesis protein SpsF (cytidylyltransferase family)
MSLFIGTIVACRLQSERLPRKALADIAGVPAIERCLLNALASKRSPKVILATSTHPDDAVLESHTLNGRVRFYRGSEKDLAARFIGAAEKFDIDIIVRVTGDSPLISYELIDLLVDAHIKAGADFSYFRDAPLGTRPEVINKPALIRLKSLISTDEYSEYLSLYFKNNPDFFKLNEVVPPKVYRYPNSRLA